MITRAIRELDRERTSLEREEKKLTIEIKKMAKELVRTRAHITKFIEMRSHLQSCGLKLQTVKSHQAMGEAMKNTTKAMMKMNKAVNTPKLSKMMAEFEKENMKSEMMQEIMGEMLDDAMEQDGDAEESDKIVSQVLDEIGVGFGEEIPDAPMAGKGTQAEEPAQNGKVAVSASAPDPALNDLEARLNNLNK